MASSMDSSQSLQSSNLLPTHANSAPKSLLSYRAIPTKNNQYTPESYLSLFSFQSIKVCSDSCLSPLGPSSKSNKDRFMITKEKSRLPLSSSSLQLSLSQLTSKKKTNFQKQVKGLLYPQLRSFTLLQPFSDHEFWFSKEGFKDQTQSSCEVLEEEEQHVYSALPIISAVCVAKTIEFVEFQHKKNVLSVHLKDKLPLTTTPIVKRFNSDSKFFQENDKISSAFNQLSMELSSLGSLEQPPVSREHIVKEIHKTVGKQTKACICLAYARNERGCFELRGIHMNEKFLVYTKWESENFMINTLETAIPELFTGKNYELMLSQSMSVIASSLSGQPTTLEFDAELLSSDGTIRETNMSVQASYQDNSLLLLNYIVEKVVKEKKAVFRKQSQSHHQSRISSKSIESSTTQKRKASSSCNSEDNNYAEEESLTLNEKIFLKRFYSQ